ncbi:MAG: hypothetical protein ACREDF_09685 [Thermoplasmata archaeon]
MPLYGLATFEHSSAYTAAIVTTIPSGVSGTRATLEEMDRLVEQAKRSAEVSELTEYVLSRFGGRQHDERSQVEAIRRGLRAGLFYVHDPRGLETLRDGRVLAAKMLAWLRGQGPRPLADCDDYTIVGRAMLEFIGIRSKSRAVGTISHGSYNHVYPMARLRNGIWIGLEATTRRFPREGFAPVSTTAPALDVPALGAERSSWETRLLDPVQRAASEVLEKTTRPVMEQLRSEVSYLKWVFIGLAAAAGAGAIYLLRRSSRRVSA